MRAIRVHTLGGPEVLQLEIVEEPQVAAPTQVLIQVKACGVNPVETYIRAGDYSLKPPLPYTPGTDAAGVVASAGEETRFKKGERVYSLGTLTGSYAEYTLAEQTHVFPLPESCTFEEGACLGIPWTTAYRALFQVGQAHSQEKLLIHGATGGVGTAALQLAKNAQLTVYATGGTEQGLNLLKELGAHQTFNHHRSNLEEAILRETQGEGVDLIVEMAAHKNLARDLALLKKKGRIVIVGSRGSTTINPREIMMKACTVTGMVLFHAPQEEVKEAQEFIFDALRRKTLKPVVGAVFPLTEAAKAHERMGAGGACGKLVLIP